MKSRTEYVRKEYVKEMRRQTVTHKRFKRLVYQWIDLSIEHSLLTMRISEPRPSRYAGIRYSQRESRMANLGSNKRPGKVRAQTIPKGEKILALCEEHH